MSSNTIYILDIFSLEINSKNDSKTIQNTCIFKTGIKMR